MPAAPPADVAISNRPFSVEPYTGIMLTDGIFDTAVQKQIITCFVTNTSAGDLKNLSVYLEGVGDPRIQVTRNSILIPLLKQGASCKVGWLADFSSATPGKHLVTIRAVADQTSVRRIFKKIFVSQTRYDYASKTYECQVPEGTFKLQFEKLIGPKYPNHPENLPKPGPWLLSGFTATLNAPFDGQDGPLPFQDPIWKIICAIVALLAFLGSLLAANDDSNNGSAVTCETDPATGDQVCSAPAPLGAVLLLIAGAALKGCLADRKDPWIRGREATAPLPSERTLAEIVSATIAYPNEITAGGKYSSDINWSYKRITNGNVYSHSVSESVPNEYVMKSVILHAPATLSLATSPKLKIEAQITHDSGHIYKGTELIASAWVQAPNGKVVKVSLADDGIDDAIANDGWYSGLMDLHAAAESAHLSDPKGIWTIYALAQTVNGATDGMTSVQAAQYTGGDPVVAPVSLSYGAGNCSAGHSIQVSVVA
jgi:hypothetical protein